MNQQGFFIQPPTRPHFVSHFQYSGTNRLFSEVECDAIIAMGVQRGFGKAAIGNPGASQVNESYRCASVALIEHVKDSQWLYERITGRVQAANQHFEFDLSGLLELIRYDAPATESAEAGHYDWHQDFGADYMARRKLSMVAQMTDPSEYDGCRLTIMDPGPRELDGTYTERGGGVIFPSWSPHCVTPIRRGTRHALVAWVHGTPFR
jgi:PKHD-type hydroxylase